MEQITYAPSFLIRTRHGPVGATMTVDGKILLRLDTKLAALSPDAASELAEALLDLVAEATVQAKVREAATTTEDVR